VKNVLKESRAKILFILLLTFSALVLGACAAQPARRWIKTPGWSRAQLIGNTRVGDPVQLAVDKDGNVYVFYIAATEDGPRIHIHAMDKNANTLWGQTFTEIELSIPSEPKLILNGEVLNLYWVMLDRLYRVQVDKHGEIVSPPEILSGDVTVETYDVARDQDGNIAVWFSQSEDQRGVFALESGEILPVDRAGTRVDIQYDGNGVLHAVWARPSLDRNRQDFYYGAYPSGRFEPDFAKIAASPPIYGTVIFEGPHLGLDLTHAYIFWSLTYLSGEEAGTAETIYSYFPIGHPEVASYEQNLTVPYSYDLRYDERDSDAPPTGERVHLEDGFIGGGRYITQVNPGPTVGEELVVAFHARLGYLLRKTQSQVSSVFLQDGDNRGYQELSFTSSFSSQPSIFSDEEGHLYLTWLEKGALPGWMVYFASTAPSLSNGLGGVTVDDVGRVSAEAVFGFLTGALLIPVAFIWIIPAMIVFVIFSRLLRSDEKATDTRGLLTLGFTLVALWVAKISVLPGMRDYVPFSAWIVFLPEWIRTPLLLGVPFIIAVGSLVLAWIISSREEEPTTYRIVVAYIIIDAILTMAIYGVLIYAAF
jgi:hypothetical protein